MELLLWFVYQDDEIVRLSRITSVPGDVEKYWEAFFKPPFAGGGLTKVVKEHVEVPERLMGVSGTAYVLYENDRRHRAVLPYFSIPEEGKVV